MEPSVSGPGVVQVGRVVAALGYVTAFGHVSRRTSGTSYEITGPSDLATMGDEDVVTVDVAATRLPEGAPAEAWLHTAIYRARPDAGAVVRAQPVAAFAAAAATDALPVLHGQTAWLSPVARGGRHVVPVHPGARLLRSRELGEAAAATLGAGDAMLLRGNGAVAVGVDAVVAAARMHLLAMACEVWLRASAAGPAPAELSAQDVDAWRTAGEALLPRLWAHLSATGRRP